MPEDIEKRRERGRRWYASNIDKARKLGRENMRRRRIRDPDYEKRVHALRRACFPEKIRAKNRRGHGIPEPTRPHPVECECCGSTVPGGVEPRYFKVDHDHTTGAFRGWLCHKCNTGIALLGDSLPGLRKAVAYLERVR